MKALIHQSKSAVVESRPTPQPTADEILVRTVAHCLTNADFSPWISGYEFAGAVEAVGDEANAELVGRRFMGTVAAAFAEVVTVRQARLHS